MSFSNRSRFIVLFLVIILLVALPLVVLLIQYQMSIRHSTADIMVKLVVNPTHPGNAISPDFAGFSIETASVCSILKLDKQDPAFAQLFMNLGPATMRFGGNTVDTTSWSPNGISSCAQNATVLNKVSIDRLFTFARKIGWKIIWGVNLKKFDPNTNADQAAYVVRSGRSSLLAIEFGNEPEYFGAGYSYSQFKSQWEAYFKALHARVSKVAIEGPSSSYLEYIIKLIKDEGARLSIITGHLYSGCANKKHPPTISDLLTHETMTKAMTVFDNIVRAAKAKNLPEQKDETNSYCFGGQLGVSNVFASALWGADYMFSSLKHGVIRMNFHGVPNIPESNPYGLNFYYSPINGTTPTPLYYGMLFFHYAAGDGNIVPVQINSSINISAHATVDSAGKLRVVIINKDQSNSATVQVNTIASYTSASILRLLAPSLSATNGITLGGSSVATNGTWRPKTFESVAFDGNTSRIAVPAASAVEVTYNHGSGELPYPVAVKSPSYWDTILHTQVITNYIEGDYWVHFLGTSSLLAFLTVLYVSIATGLDTDLFANITFISPTQLFNWKSRYSCDARIIWHNTVITIEAKQKMHPIPYPNYSMN